VVGVAQGARAPPPSHNFATSSRRPKYKNAFSFTGLRPLTPDVQYKLM